jgi:hypothetical protein
MRTELDCLPCLLRQAIDVARMTCEAPEDVRRVVSHALETLATMPDAPPPLVAAATHRECRLLTGVDDPYAALKGRYTETALGMLPELSGLVHAAEDPLDAAVRVAIAGNIIDFGHAGAEADLPLRETLAHALREPFAIDGTSALRSALAAAETVLVLGDNAGEIVFDIPLLEVIGPARIVYAVRGEPVLNDATRADAEASGLAGRVRVIDNGADVPGTALERCSAPFREAFGRADCVIAKGQGNYETLEAVTRPGLFFLLKVKCPVIARRTGAPAGSLVAAHAERLRD